MAPRSGPSAVAECLGTFLSLTQTPLLSAPSHEAAQTIQRGFEYNTEPLPQAVGSVGIRVGLG